MQPFANEKWVGSKIFPSFFHRVIFFRHAGVRSIAVDPGFGFGKTTGDNLRLLGAGVRFLELGYPVLVGISRKSSIGKALSTTDVPWPVDRRLFGSLGATAWAVSRGASIIRTHDVSETSQMLTVLTACMQAAS